jgi:hypothetical protein
MYHHSSPHETYRSDYSIVNRFVKNFTNDNIPMMMQYTYYGVLCSVVAVSINLNKNEISFLGMQWVNNATSLDSSSRFIYV